MILVFLFDWRSDTEEDQATNNARDLRMCLGLRYNVVQSLVRRQKNCQEWKSEQVEMETLEDTNL